MRGKEQTRERAEPVRTGPRSHSHQRHLAQQWQVFLERLEATSDPDNSFLAGSDPTRMDALKQEPRLFGPRDCAELLQEGVELNLRRLADNPRNFGRQLDRSYRRAAYHYINYPQGKMLWLASLPSSTLVRSTMGDEWIVRLLARHLQLVDALSHLDMITAVQHLMAFTVCRFLSICPLQGHLQPSPRSARALARVRQRLENEGALLLQPDRLASIMGRVNQPPAWYLCMLLALARRFDLLGPDKQHYALVELEEGLRVGDAPRVTIAIMDTLYNMDVERLVSPAQLESTGGSGWRNRD